ncbi:MAG TPA: hypothetical protein VFV52_14920 [Bacilli bacterium]|nr:hypothetical protein [Bacilli bacterium]
MSLKNLELQVALPRTVENSRMQQQLQQQSALQNAQAREEMTQDARRTEQSVTDSEESAQTALRDRQGKGEQQREADHRRSVLPSAEEAETPHPYKGHRLDIKL